MTAFASPLGILIRGPDKWASQGGDYHAARQHAGRADQHEGIDALTIPGQPIILPAAGTPVRVADPYPDKKDSTLLGILIAMGGGVEIKMLYLAPRSGLWGKLWPAGTVIGHAQSMQHLYPGIQDHIHIEVWLNGVRVDPRPFFLA